MSINQFVKNGFIIKSYEEICKTEIPQYYGIGRFLTWPLDVCQDSMSRALVSEATERWFGYRDDRLWVVPDLEYISRYVKHCHELNINVFCLQVDSENPIIQTEASLPVLKSLGYDYADVDMCTSCLYDDLCGSIMVGEEHSEAIQRMLNEYGLFSSVDDMREYLKIREQWVKGITELEEYYSLSIVRLTQVSVHEL